MKRENFGLNNRNFIKFPLAVKNQTNPNSSTYTEDPKMVQKHSTNLNFSNGTNKNFPFKKQKKKNCSKYPKLR